MKQFILSRTIVGKSGAFGKLEGEGFACFTLERAYPAENTMFFPKLPPGTYTAKRYPSPHFGYDVFCIQNVPGHSMMELHKGNFQEDSNGCVLLGEKSFPDNPKPGITDSTAAFNRFMALLAGEDEIGLVVR